MLSSSKPLVKRALSFSACVYSLSDVSSWLGSVIVAYCTGSTGREGAGGDGDQHRLVVEYKGIEVMDHYSQYRNSLQPTALTVGILGS